MLKLCNSEQFPVLTSQLFTFRMQYVHKHLPRSYVIRRHLLHVDKVGWVELGYSIGYLLYTALYDLYCTIHFRMLTLSAF